MDQTEFVRGGYFRPKYEDLGWAPVLTSSEAFKSGGRNTPAGQFSESRRIVR